MRFEEAYDKMKKENKKIRLPHWENIYWFMVNNYIMVYNNGSKYRFGDCLNFRLKNLFRTDWEVM